MEKFVTLVEHYTSPDFSTLIVVVHYQDEEKMLSTSIATRDGQSYSKLINKEEYDIFTNLHWEYLCVYHD